MSDSIEMWTITRPGRFSQQSRKKFPERKCAQADVQSGAISCRFVSAHLLHVEKSIYFWYIPHNFSTTTSGCGWDRTTPLFIAMYSFPPKISLTHHILSVGWPTAKPAGSSVKFCRRTLPASACPIIACHARNDRHSFDIHLFIYFSSKESLRLVPFDFQWRNLRIENDSAYLLQGIQRPVIMPTSPTDLYDP